jgi:hypothetical protein
MRIVTKVEARAQGLKFFYPGPCVHGHVSKRYVSTGHCFTCLRGWQKANRDKMVAYDRMYRDRNPGVDKRYRDRNLEKVRAYERAYRERDPDKWRAYDTEYGRRYRQENAERVREYEARYRKQIRGRCNAWARAYQVAKDRRTPPWLTDEQLRAIEAFYEEAARLTCETGVVHHVDHVVPLRGRVRGQKGVAVSGLHVPWNLRVMPGPENIARSCYFDPDHV